jgi:hypothetical protein
MSGLRAPYAVSLIKALGLEKSGQHAFRRGRNRRWYLLVSIPL